MGGRGSDGAAVEGSGGSRAAEMPRSAARPLAVAWRAVFVLVTHPKFTRLSM